MFKAFVLLVAVITVAACGSSSSPGGSGKSGQAVEIGLPYLANVGGLSASLGASVPGGAPPTDQQEQAYYQAVATYIDNHGGLFGHHIKLVFYGLTPTNQESAAVTDQSECTDFTQDHHVFAVMTAGPSDISLVACLQHANTIIFDPASYTYFDDAMFSQYPLYATAGTLSLTRVASVEVNGLYKAGYFDKGSKIGLIGYNSPAFTRAIDQVMKPALARHGLSLADETLVAPVTGLSDVGPEQEAISDAILRFKQEGINHVMFFDVEGATLYPWLAAAPTQKYFPRLGFTSNQTPAERSGSFAASQAANYVAALSNSVVIGWNSSLDVTQPPTNSTGALCNSIMEGAGAVPTVAIQFRPTCDQLLAFAAAVNAGGKLTPSAAIAGLGKAKTIPSAVLLGPPVFSGGRRDGASVGRFLSFDKGCLCYQYTGASFPLDPLENS